ncbi:MAG: hypothetical protein ACHQRJ_14110 [Alphaproteobacteria bacterium]
MPAQPLSLVKPTATVYTEPSPFEKVPDLVVLISRTIAMASEIEAHTETLLVMMLGASAAPAAAMLQALTSTAATRAVLSAAAEVVLPKHEFEIFEIIMGITERYLRPRKQFAHATWAWSPDVPDAVLFIEQSARMALNLQVERAVRERMGPSNAKFDPSLIWVYREKDIQDALKGLKRALSLIVRFRMMMNGGPLWRDQQRARLLAEPEIAEALSRLRNRQKANPSAHPRRRQKGRTQK